jgi:hypothetical protein
MTDQTTITVLMLTAAHHNFHGEFSFAEEVDKATGEYKAVAKVTHLEPGTVYDLPAALASELIEAGAARLLTKQESQLHALDTGAATFVDRGNAPANPADFYEGVGS